MASGQLEWVQGEKEEEQQQHQSISVVSFCGTLPAKEATREANRLLMLRRGQFILKHSMTVLSVMLLICTCIIIEVQSDSGPSIREVFSSDSRTIRDLNELGSHSSPSALASAQQDELLQSDSSLETANQQDGITMPDKRPQLARSPRTTTRRRNMSTSTTSTTSTASSPASSTAPTEADTVLTSTLKPTSSTRAVSGSKTRPTQEDEAQDEAELLAEAEAEAEEAERAAARRRRLRNRKKTAQSADSSTSPAGPLSTSSTANSTSATEASASSGATTSSRLPLSPPLPIANRRPVIKATDNSSDSQGPSRRKTASNVSSAISQQAGSPERAFNSTRPLGDGSRESTGDLSGGAEEAELVDEVTKLPNLPKVMFKSASDNQTIYTLNSSELVNHPISEWSNQLPGLLRRDFEKLTRKLLHVFSDLMSVTIIASKHPANVSSLSSDSTIMHNSTAESLAKNRAVPADEPINTTSHNETASLVRRIVNPIEMTPNVTDKSMDQIVQDIREENLKLEDNVREQGNSLKHFIIVCSISVVVATSLVVALIVLLTK